MTSRLKSMMSNQHFRYGTENELDQLVTYERKDNPGKVPYAIGFSLEHPGWFTLFYVLNVTVKHEFIGLHPNRFV